MIAVADNLLWVLDRLPLVACVIYFLALGVACCAAAFLDEKISNFCSSRKTSSDR
jgi:hypothetical protein